MLLRSFVIASLLLIAVATGQPSEVGIPVAGPDAASAAPPWFIHSFINFSEHFTNAIAALRAETAAQFEAQRAETAAQFEAQRSESATRFEAQRVDIAALRNDSAARFEAQRADSAAMRVDITAMRVDITALRTDITALRTDMASLSEGVVTPAVASRVSTCSPTTVGFALIRGGSPGNFTNTECSTFPVPSEILLASAFASTASASTSTFFLSSAHCFMDNTSTVVFSNVSITFGVEHYCSLLTHFLDRAPPADLYDLAIIKCPTPVAIPPSRISTKLYGQQLPVVMVGFSVGDHTDPNRLVFLEVENPDGVRVTTRFAPHTQFTRLADSFQLPLDKASTSAVSRGFTTDGLSAPSYGAAASSAGGFVSDSPPGGMSGGAVMDTDCGVFGITERRSTNAQGGQFVRLTPDVIQMLAAAISAPSAL